MYNSRFHAFIHSKKGLEYLLSHYDGKTEVVDNIHDAYNQLKMIYLNLVFFVTA